MVRYLERQSQETTSEYKKLTFSGEEGNGGTLGTSTASTTNTVNIVLRVVGVVIVQDMSDVAHIFSNTIGLANRAISGGKSNCGQRRAPFSQSCRT
jgi:hypothetical protein